MGISPVASPRCNRVILRSEDREKVFNFPFTNKGGKKEASGTREDPQAAETRRLSPAILNLCMEQFQVGFRFLPTEEELVNNYLKSKVLGYDDKCVIPELKDFYAWDPWDLPSLYQRISNIPSDGRDWYFFCPSPYLAQNRERVRRQTKSGKWKITCQKDDIKTQGAKALIGTKRILVFHKGRAKTGWVMHEYHLNPKLLDGYSSTLQIPYVLCRLKRRASESLAISPSFEGGFCVADDTQVASQHEDTDQESSFQATVESLPQFQALGNYLPNYGSYCTFDPQPLVYDGGQGDDSW